MGRLGVLFDHRPCDDAVWFIADEIKDGDVEAALERAIADIRGAMQPLTPEEISSHVAAGVEDPRPLQQDVALTHGGRVLVLIQAAASGPVVTRIGATGPASPAGPS